MTTALRDATRERRDVGRPELRRNRRRRVPMCSGILALSLTACDDAFVQNLNDPELPTVITTSAQLQAQATGIAAGDRENHAFQILILETMGRDAYRLDVADPRFITNPLGVFEPSAFIANFLWNSHYRTIRSANELNAGIDASTFSTQDKGATRGFAQTFKAHQYMRLIEMRDTLGVPISLGAGALDPVRCKPAVLAYTSALLDSAATDLAPAGAQFPFQLPGGFSLNGSFTTPPQFLRFNRGLKAKNEMYRGFLTYARTGTVDQAALSAALAAVDASLASTSAPLRSGVYHVYSSASGDLTNALFDNSVYRANPKVLTEAEAGDQRVAAKVVRVASSRVEVQGVASDILFLVYTGPTSPIPLLLNEELLLVRAQILWGLNRDAEALAIVNQIRQQSGGLAPRGSFPNRLDLMREILKQKRYSLLFESSSRLVDYRMLGLFGELGTERTPPVAGPAVLPMPEAESDARGGNVACTA